MVSLFLFVNVIIGLSTKSINYHDFAILQLQYPNQRLIFIAPHESGANFYRLVLIPMMDFLYNQ